MTLSVLDAAREVPERVALAIDAREITFRELGERVATLGPFEGGENRPFPLVAHPTLDALVTLYAAFEHHRPVALVHPRLPEAERARLAALAATFRAAGPSPLAFVFTSGTSGEPKAVELSRAAVTAAAAASSQWLGWRDDDRWLLALPFAHVGGLSVLTRCLLARRCVEVAAPEILVQRDHVTLASLVPAQLAKLAGRAPPPKLRAVLLGGASAPPQLLAKARANGWPILMTYGMTETCGQIATERPSRAGFGLEPLPGSEIRVVEGRLQVRTSAAMTAYHPLGAHPSPFTRDGWLETKDLGSFDAGSLEVDGRADDIIVTGGEKVAPLSVERALLSCNGVSEACAFGLEDEIYGRIVAAAVVITKGGPSVSELLAAVAQKLAPFERPRRVMFVKGLPLNAMGKVDRRMAARLCRL